MRLKLKNFRCYDDAEFDFGENGLTLLSGSSGTGKTTLLMAIDFALFGNGKKLVQNGKKSCTVELELQDLKIVRTSSPRRLVVNDAYEDAAGEAVIQAKFGKVFNSVSYIPQSLKETFVMMTPARRLEFLEEFAFSDVDVAKIKLRAKEEARQVQLDLEKVVGKLEFASKMFEEMEKPVKIKFPFKVDDEEEAIKTVNIKYKNCIARIKKAESYIKKLEQEINDKNILNAVLDEKHLQRSKLQQQLNEICTDFQPCYKISLDDMKILLKKKISLRELSNLQSQYNINLQRLEEMKEKELQDKELMISTLEANMYTSISKDELDENLEMMKSFNDDFMKIRMKKEEVNNLKQKISSIPRDVAEKLEQALKTISHCSSTLSLVKDLRDCPHCHKKVRLNNGGVLCKVDNEDSNKQDKEHLEKELANATIQKQLLEPLAKTFTNASARIQVLESEIFSMIENINENGLVLDEIPEQYKEMLAYKQENVANEKKLQELKSNKNVFSPSVRMLQNSLDKDKQRIEQLLVNDIEDDPSVSEEDLRKYIDIDTKAQETVERAKSLKLKISQEILQIMNEVDRLTSEHSSKYPEHLDNVSVITDQQEVIKSNEEKRDKYAEILKKIEKYNDSKKAILAYENARLQLNALKEEEKMLRSKYSASLTLKEKILEAESIAISNIIDTINTHVQLYLEHFFPDNPINVTISAFKETKSNDAKPQINLDIDYRGIEHDLSMLSGGEMSRVILAFTLALAEIQDSPLILLDECTSSLDQELTSSVIDGLKENFGEKLVLLIAHQVVQGSFDKVVNLS